MTQLDVLRVFCAADGGHGNPLGVVLDAGAVAPAERQRIAAALGFSETVFVDDAAAGAVRIYTPGKELPLAGHPLVGTSWLLAREGAPVDVLRPPAGDVATAADADGAWIAADPAAAPPFVLCGYATAAEVEGLPVPAGPDVHLDAWAWIDEQAGTVRSRVFAAGVGVPEDEATGAAALRLTAHLGRAVTIHQGAGSVIAAEPLDDGRVRVGGRVDHDHRLPLTDALADPAALRG
ncbi:PhzF family phenazine biosynthesis protein [Patulibacter sp. SYSU D01012]|uniref:PhzF family phenazine biosynthesis protein n=1 Tax=Patulibacter sp. SYSU D01012 TaxID=2817381 RepID=UPI001B30ED91|nr:PhzF family phenazine biosynthesis protein [Patulibacter sp. SYSU D01012]